MGVKSETSVDTEKREGGCGSGNRLGLVEVEVIHGKGVGVTIVVVEYRPNTVG